MPKRPCHNNGKKAGCLQWAEPSSGYCAACRPAATAEAQRAYDARRPNSAGRDYDAGWRTAAAAYLAAHPWCAVGSCRTRAVAVDHLVAVAIAPAWRMNPGNWWGLCAACHRRKTTIERTLGLTRGATVDGLPGDVDLGDLPRLTIWVGGASYAAERVIGERDWWRAVLAGGEAVRGVWQRGNAECGMRNAECGMRSEEKYKAQS